MELHSPGSFPRAVFPYSASPEVDAAAHTSALGTEVLDVQTQLWMEGLEKWSSFIETGLVKLASEPSTEIMWLLTMQHHPRPLRESPGKARGRGAHAWGAGAAAAGQLSHIWENPALIFKAVCCGSAEYGNFISKAECLLCSSGRQHLARCHCGCQRVLAVFVKAGSQCFPTSLGLSSSCVNKGYSTGEDMMLRCSRKANDQRASYMGHFALVVW